MVYTARPRPTSLDDLKAELIRNAAFAAYEGHKAKALSQWLAEKPGRRVIYVYDTDTVLSHCAPWRSGPADDDFLGGGYGQILPRKPLTSYSVEERGPIQVSERRRAEAVCWILAKTVVQRAFDQKMPIIQTRSHFRETLRIYERVKSRANLENVKLHKSSEGRDGYVLDQALRFISRALSRKDWSVSASPGRFLTNVLQQIQLNDLQRTSRLVREWDKFVDLIRRSGGLFQLSEFRPSVRALPQTEVESWKKVSADLSTSADPSELEKQSFFDVFEKVITPENFQRARENLRDDILALSEVMKANELLSQQGDGIRVVLITGDRKMVLALAQSQLTLPIFDGHVSDFAFNHVHHLWSALDEIAPNSIAGKSKISHPALFSGLLAFDDQFSTERARNRQLIKYAIKSDMNVALRLRDIDIDQAYERWAEFSSVATNLHRYFLIDQPGTQEISRILIEKFKYAKVEVTSSSLRKLVVETIERARDRTNVEFSEIGANSILDAYRHGVRNPPDLMFDSLKNTNEIFRDLAKPYTVFQDADDFARRFEEIRRDCYQPSPEDPDDDDFRQECYLKYLVLGALFASADRWVVAEQHAESAIRIVERAKSLGNPIRTLDPSFGDRKSNMSGREAYYLLAVSKRVRSRSSFEYDDAAEALERARICLAEDSVTTVPVERFDCEDLALTLARYYHRRSIHESDHANDLIEVLFDQARALIHKSRISWTEKDRFADKRGGHLPPSTRVSIAVNIIQSMIIEHSRKDHGFRGPSLSIENESDTMRDAIGTILSDTDFVEKFEGITGLSQPICHSKTAQVICSGMMMLYTATAAVVFQDSRVNGPRSKEDVADLFKFQSRCVTQYDAWRYESLRNIFVSSLSGI